MHCSVRNDDRPAEISHYWKLQRKRKVFSSWRNDLLFLHCKTRVIVIGLLKATYLLTYVDSDEAALTEEGKSFHALDAATGSARSPSVERFVSATTNVSETEEQIGNRNFWPADRTTITSTETSGTSLIPATELALQSDYTQAAKIKYVTHLTESTTDNILRFIYTWKSEKSAKLMVIRTSMAVELLTKCD